jgi:signal transduction histidine kinase
MSGRIWCEARPGGGSTFIVSVKRYVDEAPPQREARTQ